MGKDYDIRHTDVLKTFKYDPITGYIYRFKKGSFIRTISFPTSIAICGETISLRKLIVFYMTKRWTTRAVVFLDGNEFNLKYSNLQEVFETFDYSENIPLKLLKTILEYNPETGNWIWKETLGYKAIKGNIANYTVGEYQNVSIRHDCYSAHRLAWFYMTGEWPDIIDHQDHDKINNKWKNLSNGTSQDNNRNRKITKTNTSGCIGVVWHSRDKVWQVTIDHGGKSVYKGGFKDFDKAVKIRKAAEREYGYHRNHNKGMLLQ